MTILYQVLETKLHKLSGTGHVVSFCVDELRGDLEEQARATFETKLSEETEHLRESIASLRHVVALFQAWELEGTWEKLVELVKWFAREAQMKVSIVLTSDGKIEPSLRGPWLDYTLGALALLWFRQESTAQLVIDGSTAKLCVTGLSTPPEKTTEYQLGGIFALETIFKERACLLDELSIGKSGEARIQYLMHAASTFELVEQN
jgi:hypothetical protein